MSAAVTGATGFIGGRLVEALASRGLQVTALVRDYRRVARLGRLDVRLHKCDLDEPTTFASVLANVDTIFHCAYEWLPDASAEERMNLRLATKLAETALHVGTNRFIQISSMAVYGHDLPHFVTEDTPPSPTTSYGRTKLEIDRALEALLPMGLDLTIIRPTKVFGPYDYAFTVKTVDKLRHGKLRLVEGGRGIVSPTYVDNLVQLILLAHESSARRHRCYIASDDVHLTWAEFYRYFAAMTECEPTGSVTQVEVERHSTQNLFGGDSASIPSLGEYRDFMRRGRFCPRAAKADLGYVPELGLDKAMALTASWLRHAQLL